MPSGCFLDTKVLIYAATGRHDYPRHWEIAHDILAADTDLVVEGIALSQRYKISYRDAAIIAAAGRLGAGTLYTEDLNHGQLLGTVRVVNPFPRR